jgi:hypothetical protein
LAAGAQWNLGVFALRGSFGYFPLVLSVDDDVFDDNAPSYEVLHSYQLNADAAYYFWAPAKSSRLGLSFGYRYNSELAHGAAVGLQVEADVSKSLAVMVLFALSMYPDGDDRARQALNESSEAKFNFPFGAGLQGGLGIGMRFNL